MLLLLLPACRLGMRIRQARYTTTTATAITGAELVGGIEVDTGRFVLLRYERFFNIRGRSDSWSNNALFVQVRSIAALPLGQAVAVPGPAATISGYLKGTWYFENRKDIVGTITRLASSAAGHRLKLRLQYTTPKGQPGTRLDKTVWFRADPTYFQRRQVDYKGKYDDLRLALKEPAKVKSLDLVTYAIQYRKRNGHDSAPPDTLYRRLGELYNLEELSLHLSDLVSLPVGILQMKRLRKLDLGYNHLTEFPVQLYTLDSLQELNLEWNRIDSIPASVTQLQQLRSLNLNDNKLNRYPTAVNSLTGLRELGLANANLRAVPAQIQQLANLEVLDLDGFWNSKRRNQLRDISALITLSRLRSLSIKDNGTLEEIAGQLYQLQGLEELDVGWGSEGPPVIDVTRFPKLKKVKR